MAPGKMVLVADSSAGKDAPENQITEEALSTAPLTDCNWRMAPTTAPVSVEQGLSAACNNSNAEDIGGDYRDCVSDDDVLIMGQKLSKVGMSVDADVDVNTTPTGRFLNVATESSSEGSKNVEKYKAKKTSPDTESFICNTAGSRSDDPFSSAYKPPQRRGRQSHSTQVTPTSNRLNTRTQGNWRIGGGSSQNSESPTRPNQTPSPEGGPKISGQNAQSHYSPSACIFVANLSSTETETELEAAVTKMFRCYGTVFVKIRRDPKNMPYAFCQFTDDADAMHALEDSRGRLIHGRPVRTERARANRMFSFRRLNGNPVTIEECRHNLEQYGPIESIWYPSQDQLNVLQFHGAILLQFAFFDDGRKAQHGVRSEAVFQLDSIAHLLQGSSPRSSGRRIQRNLQRAQDYLREYDHDRNSIFVGNLPQDYTEVKIRAVFELYGTVVKVVVHQKASLRNPGQIFSYCFVEYSDPAAPSRAIAAKNNDLLEGHIVKVSAKDSEYRSARFRSYNTPGGAGSHRSSQALHMADSQQPGYNPQGYGFLPTPPQYGYGACYHPSYASPWTYNWVNGYAFSAPPPTYHGIVPAAPTPNPMFNTTYPQQADYSGQSYPPGSYAYQAYPVQGSTAAPALAQDYQAPADNDISQPEENKTDLQ